MSMVEFDVSPRARDYTQSTLKGLIPDESELTAGCLIEPGKSYGFFTDTTVCIGCKACEVACKEWNNLPADEVGLTGHSYDNTGSLSANTWRHVAFVEKKARAKEADGYGIRENEQAAFQSGWLMMSDVCKHCHHAPCMEACPTALCSRPSSTPWWCSRTSATAAATACRPVPSGWWTSRPPTARRTSAPSATTG